MQSSIPVVILLLAQQVASNITLGLLATLHLLIGTWQAQRHPFFPQQLTLHIKRMTSASVASQACAEIASRQNLLQALEFLLVKLQVLPKQQRERLAQV